MKLVSLTATGGTFKNIHFKSGFNVILAEKVRAKDRNTDTHDVGKSTIVQLVDFMMLKELKPGHFLKKHKFFLNYTFYLQIKTNANSYILIKRSIIAASKVSFSFRNEEFVEDQIPQLEWDESNVALRKAVSLLNRYLNFNVVNDYDYRKSITYFLRNQGDYSDLFQLSKFGPGLHKDWKPFIFELLGFDSEAVAKKYSIENDIDNLKNLIGELAARFNISQSNIDLVNGQIEIISKEKSALEAQVDQFSFYDSDTKVIIESTDEIEKRISILNEELYNLRYELGRVEASISSKSIIDIAEIEQLYKEVNILFPQYLIKSYDELQVFTRQITEERGTLLKSQSLKILEQISQIQQELKVLDERRKAALTLIREKKTLQKYLGYQKEVARLESEIAFLLARKDQFNIAGSLESQIQSLRIDESKMQEVIRTQLALGNPTYSTIRDFFHRIVFSVLRKSALISVTMNQSGNVDFREFIYDSTDNELTSESEGVSYKKILCACFDIAILLTYNYESFFRFVFHDGIIEGLDGRKKENFLRLVKVICERRDIQYIMTAIEDDIAGVDKDIITEEVIVLRLSDNNDQGKLFERSY